MSIHTQATNHPPSRLSLPALKKSVPFPVNNASSPMLQRFPHYQQHDAMDCGPACLRMIARHYGQHYSLSYLREQCHLDREGVSLQGIIEAAEQIGFRTVPVQLPLYGSDDRPGLADAPLPLIVHWEQRHFVVVYRISI